jgi:uncharacterized protein (TIGR03437 family)
MNPTNTLTLFAVLLLLLGAGSAPAAAQGLYNRNLVVNGDAEAAAGTGWKTFGSFSTAAYSSDSISSSDDGPVDRGRSYFTGGSNGSVRSYAEQVIRLDGVDAGAKFYFSAFLGKNYGNLDPKFITLTASFMNDQSAVVQEAVLNGPAVATDYNIPGGLMLRAMSGFLAPGITQVKVTLDFGTVTGTSGNPYVADNISLALTQESPTGLNLIVNGNAEVPDGTPLAGWSSPRPADRSDKPVPGWNATPSLTAAKYSAWGFNADTPGPRPDARGNYLLALDVGGDRGKVERISQVIDVPASKISGAPMSKLLELIDGGKITYQLSGWLGHYKNSVDGVTLRLSFYGAAQTNPLVSAAELSSVSSQDHGNYTGMVERSSSGPVPPNTRRILVELIGTKVSTVVDNMQLVADNLSLVLTAPDTGVKLVGITSSGSGAAAPPIAPGEMVTLAVSGIDLTSTTRMQLDSNGLVSNSLSGITVTFDTTPAPLLYVSAKQIGAIVPFDVDGKAKVAVQVNYKGDKSAPQTYDVAAAVPGIFTQEAPGSGNTAGQIWNDNWTLNSAGNPASKGSVVTILWTGGGQTVPVGITGRIETQSLPQPAQPVSVTIDGQAAELVSAGAVPNSWAGLLMARVKVPDGAGTSGPVAVVITVGGASSPADAATMSVQ